MVQTNVASQLQTIFDNMFNVNKMWSTAYYSLLNSNFAGRVGTSVKPKFLYKRQWLLITADTIFVKKEERQCLSNFDN